MWKLIPEGERSKLHKSGHQPKEGRKSKEQKEEGQQTHAEEFSKPSHVRKAQWDLLAFIK